MDTTERRVNLAKHLRQLANTISEATSAYDFDLALEELDRVGRDVNGYHARTLEAMYDEENPYN
jgi:hypothetical protein